MTKLDRFEENTGLTSIGHSSVWNFHNVVIDNVALNSNSNLNKSLKELKGNGVTGIVTLYVDGIGRSQHDESSVHIFEGTTDSDNCPGYLGSRIGEVRMDRV